MDFVEKGLSLLSLIIAATAITTNIRRHEVLSDDFSVEWEGKLANGKGTIHFQVTARTTGYVGFGFSRNGKMEGADIVIGGLHGNGTQYFMDYHGVGNTKPVLDKIQDWELLDAFENCTHTWLSFKRLLNTCDMNDVEVTNDTIKLIWSIGVGDDIEYHSRKGAHDVNLLDPETPELNSSSFIKWKIAVNKTIPTRQTTYSCTLHKFVADSSKKLHIVGFRTMLENSLAVKHNHHLLIHHCLSDPRWFVNMTQHYQKFLDGEGGECYQMDGSGMHELRNEFCQPVFYGWAKGGKPLVLPDDVGLPVCEYSNEEYFLLELHYDNPDVLAGIQYETGVEILLTADLRKHEAGTFIVGSEMHFTGVVPPRISEYVLAGHCSPACTEKNFPEEGITVFNVMLHAHLAGRKLKLRHFRQAVELPWVAKDDFYDFDFQQSRPLIERRHVAKNDQLTLECTYDSMHLNPAAAVLPGFSTRNEMCMTFVMHYPRVEKFDRCLSRLLDFHPFLQEFGIEAIDETNTLDPTILSPPRLAHVKFSEFASFVTNWSPKWKSEIQNMTKLNYHKGSCEGGLRSPFNGNFAGPVKYPENLQEYYPPQTCLAFRD